MTSWSVDLVGLSLLRASGYSDLLLLLLSMLLLLSSLGRGTQFKHPFRSSSHGAISQW